MNQIQISQPFWEAYERMKAYLFRPFNATRWFNVGLSAWLVQLGGGGGFNVPFNGLGNSTKDSSSSAASSTSDTFGNFLGQNLWVIVGVVVAGLVVLLLVGILVSWLSSRGQFMLLDNLVREREEVASVWREWKREANSLFGFKVAFGILATLILLPLAAWLIVGFFGLIGKSGVFARVNAWIPAVIPRLDGSSLAVLTLVVLILVVASFYVGLFLDDFIVPIMYRHRIGVMEAWSRFTPLLSNYASAFILYSLFRLLAHMIVGFLVVLGMVLTCFIAACIIALPYIGAVLLLPIPVLFRHYSLYFLRQFGPDFDAFAVVPRAGNPDSQFPDMPPAPRSGDPENPYNPYR